MGKIMDYIDVEVVGFKLGKSSGWDDMGDWSIFYYDFIPNEEFADKFPVNWNGGINVNTTNGDIELYQHGINDPIAVMKFKDFIAK